MAYKTCKSMNTESTISFTIKSYLKVSPFSTIGYSVFFSIVIFGLGIQIFEYYNQSMIDLQLSECKPGDYYLDSYDL